MAEFYRCEQCRKFVKIVDKGTGKLICCNEPMTLINSFTSVNDILNFAIAKEEEARDFYNQWADKLRKAHIQRFFKELAQEEVKHKNLLMRVKQGKQLIVATKKIVDLKIADYLVDITPSPDMDYQNVLILAMKRERASFKLYDELAQIITNEKMRTTLEALAQEEAKHKLRLETMYEKDILLWD